MSERGLYGGRPSKCADAVRRQEFEEIAAMDVRERMLLGLELGDLCRLIERGARRARARPR